MNKSLPIALLLTAAASAVAVAASDAALVETLGPASLGSSSSFGQAAVGAGGAWNQGQTLTLATPKSSDHFSLGVAIIWPWTTCTLPPLDLSSTTPVSLTITAP